jgi:nucleoside-diphosphate kinase
MAGKYTLMMIKPHAVSDNNAGAILAMINEAGFRIVGLKMVRLSRSQTGEFYKEHEGKSFYAKLVDMMSSGPIVAALLEREDAVSELRRLIGNTDPGKADPGTIRQLFGRSISENAVHGSDADQTAIEECGFFFSGMER